MGKALKNPRSNAQKSILMKAREAAVRTLKGLGKENINPSTSNPESTPPAALPQTGTSKIADPYKSRYRNEHRSLLRARETRAKLRTRLNDAELINKEQAHYTKTLEHELSTSTSALAKSRDQVSILQKNKNMLRMRSERAPGMRARAVEKAVEKIQAEDTGNTHNMKDKGVFTEDTRETVRELVELGVPVEKVGRAFEAVAKGVGKKVVGSIDPRSVSRIVTEGGIASKMQLAEETGTVKSA